MLSNLLTFFFISCISIPILFSNANNIEQENICNETAPIISAFMLSGDTFFQTESGKIWRMNSTRSNDGINLGKTYLETKRVKNLESYIDEISFNKSERIFAFDYKFHYKNVCNDSDTTNDSGNNTCPLYDLDNFQTFVCLYGQNKSKKFPERDYLWEIKPRSYDNKDFSPIENVDLKKVVRQFCKDQQNLTLGKEAAKKLGCTRYSLTGWNIMKWNGTFGKWTDNNFVHLNQFYACRPPDTTKPGKIVEIIYDLYQDKTVTISSQTYPKMIRNKITDIPGHKIGLVIPIAFSGKLYLLNCPKKKCKINEQLNTTTFEKWTQYSSPSFIPEGKPPKISNDLSIAKIVRCPKIKKPFEPLSFCEKKRFDSIFSLENDIYFQRNGKFWRYSYLSAMKESLMNIRYDSYMTTLLPKIFNTSRPITGITFKIPEVCNKYYNTTYPNTTKKCPVAQEFQYKLYLTCLFGYDRKGQSRAIARPFLNFPSGIKFYPTSSLKRQYEVQGRCDAIVRQFLDASDIPLSINSNDVQFINNYQSIQYTILYHYYDKKDQKQYVWKKLVVEFKHGEEVFNETDHYWQFYDKISDYNPAIKDDEFAKSINGLFYFKSRFEGFGGIWISYIRWRQYIDVDFDLYETIFGNSISFMGKMEKSLMDLFNCTNKDVNKRLLKMSYSLSTINNPFKFLCRPELSPYDQTGYSIFNIGEYVYVQKNQRFYRYNSEGNHSNLNFEVGFLYDKQVSDLLNDVFDTKKRVVGYSFLYSYSLGNHKYRVVLMGKPNWRYIKPIGVDKIMYRVFEKERGPYPPLVPLNKVPQTEANMTFNLVDGVEFFCNQSDPSQICNPRFSLEKEDKGREYQILDAVGCLQLVNDWQEPSWINPSINSTIFNHSIFLAITNNTNRYISKDITTLFTQPLWLVIDNNTFAKKNDIFDQIYGIFSYRQQLYIMAKAHNSRRSMIYHASSLTRGNQDWEFIDPEKILGNRNSTEEFFNCSIITDSSVDLKHFLEMPKLPWQSIHKSSSSTVMIVVFYLLILILVFLVILIGVLAFTKYNTKREKTETDNQNKSKSQSKSNDKSSSESKRSLHK